MSFQCKANAQGSGYLGVHRLERVNRTCHCLGWGQNQTEDTDMEANHFIKLQMPHISQSRLQTVKSGRMHCEEDKKGQ